MGSCVVGEGLVVVVIGVVVGVNGLVGRKAEIPKIIFIINAARGETANTTLIVQIQIKIVYLKKEERYITNLYCQMWINIHKIRQYKLC